MIAIESKNDFSYMIAKINKSELMDCYLFSKKIEIVKRN